MANKYNIKWARIFRESDGTVTYSRAINHYAVDFTKCSSIDLTDLDRCQDEDYIRETYEREPGLDYAELEENGRDMPRETAEDFVDAIIAVMDNGGIEKGSRPIDDYMLETVVVYDDNDAEIYRIEWYSVDEQADADPVNERFFEAYLEINLEM